MVNFKKLKNKYLVILNKYPALKIALYILIFIFVFDLIFGASLSKIDDCTEPTTFSVQRLMSQAGVENLYYYNAKDHQSSSESQMAQENGFKGYIFPFEISNEQSVLKPEEELILTGDIWIKKPNIFAIVLVKSKKQRYFEVITKEGKYLLNLGREKRHVVKLCRSALYI